VHGGCCPKSVPLSSCPPAQASCRENQPGPACVPVLVQQWPSGIYPVQPGSPRCVIILPVLRTPLLASPAFRSLYMRCVISCPWGIQPQGGFPRALASDGLPPHCLCCPSPLLQPHNCVSTRHHVGHMLLSPSPTFAAFFLPLCTTSLLTLSQHPHQLTAPCDRAAFPCPGTKSRALPCQHLITLHPAQRTWQTLYKPKKSVNLALAGGKWRHRGLGPACGNLLACIIAPAPLPASGLQGELSAIQQPTGGTESAGRRKTAAVSCPQPPPASFNL